jgi:putative phosphonate metabolism protein
MSKRFAIYFAPQADGPLWRFGCRWLGRDPEQDRRLAPYDVPGFTVKELDAITASPRAYGFHGTLKPPFLLANGTTEAELRSAVQEFAKSVRPFTLPPLRLAHLRGFLALQPATRCDALHRLADACVQQFDRFRRLPEEAELRSRRMAGLTQRQEVLLGQFGYPYVLDQFHFHLTLTGRLDNELSARLLPWLEFELGAALMQAERVHELCLFVQDRAGDMFRLEQRFAFGEN